MKISQMIGMLAQRMSVDGDLSVGINVGKEFKRIANSFMITTEPNEEGLSEKYLIFSDTPADQMKAEAAKNTKKEKKSSKKAASGE